MDTEKARMTKEISRRIQHRRNYLRMTQEDMARRLGEPVGTYSRWDNGANPVSVVDLARIADALGVSAGYLLGEISEEEMADDAMLKLYRELPEAHQAATRAFILSLHQQVM